jgi:phosphoglycolate phosphatase-like HAD superfamily hydrolase
MNPILLFDMDGTLIIQKNTPEYEGTKTHHASYMLIKKQMKEIITNYGIPEDKIIHLNRMALIWNQTRRYLEQEGVDENGIRKLIDKINVPFMIEERKDHSQSILLQETIPVLNKLKNEGYELGLVTTASRESYEKISKDPSFGKFGKYFKNSITRDDCKYIKPDPEPIHRILKLYDNKNFIYIGDSDHDAFATQAAGGKFILVNSREYDNETLGLITPNYVIESLLELPDAIKQLMKES